MQPWLRSLPIALLFAASWTQAGNTAPYQRAKEVGVKQCLDKVNLYANHYLEYAGHGIDASSSPDRPDARLLSFFVAKGHFWGDSQVNMQFAPNPAGGCDAVATETFVAEKTCAAVREEQFADWTARGSLNGRTTVLQRGNVNVYLTPAGMAANLCLVTRREVGYS